MAAYQQSSWHSQSLWIKMYLTVVLGGSDVTNKRIKGPISDRQCRDSNPDDLILQSDALPNTPQKRRENVCKNIQTENTFFLENISYDLRSQISQRCVSLCVCLFICLTAYLIICLSTSFGPSLIAQWMRYCYLTKAPLEWFSASTRLRQTVL